eukprot:TRINITY_DN4035_c0_g1_i1.p1 TRINITY_DN4035_c0_g1~~TRINITY_DN4035_c0_g1_i1.p1  ORF type:complete len:284 (-),score=31.09 TRINITY_DN4035_c0_g1_i1:169-1020(-)
MICGIKYRMRQKQLGKPNQFKPKKISKSYNHSTKYSYSKAPVNSLYHISDIKLGNTEPDYISLEHKQITDTEVMEKVERSFLRQNSNWCYQEKKLLYRGLGRYKSELDCLSNYIGTKNLIQVHRYLEDIKKMKEFAKDLHKMPSVDVIEEYVLDAEIVNAESWLSKNSIKLRKTLHDKGSYIKGSEKDDMFIRSRCFPTTATNARGVLNITSEFATHQLKQWLRPIIMKCIVLATSDRYDFAKDRTSILATDVKQALYLNGNINEKYSDATTMEWYRMGRNNF